MQALFCVQIRSRPIESSLCCLHADWVAQIKQLLVDDGLEVLTQMFDSDEAESVDVALKLMCAVTKLPREERAMLVSRGAGDDTEMMQCMTYALTSRPLALSHKIDLLDALYRMCVDEYIRDELASPDSDNYDDHTPCVSYLVDQVKRSIGRKKLATLGDKV